MWQFWQPPVDRPGRPPTVENMTVGASVDCQSTDQQGGNTVSFYRSTDPVDRKDTESRLSISVDWVRDPVDRRTCTACAYPDTAAGRLSRSTGLPEIQFFWADFWDRKFVKNLLTLLKNPQKYVLSFYLKTKLVIKISRHISIISIHFCVLPILS